MKRYALLVVLSLVLILPTFAFASTITGATYSGTIVVTNNGTATTDVIVPFTCNTTAMISGSLVNASVNNTAVRSGSTDVAYMPDPTTNNWWVLVPSIAGTVTSINYNLYTGGPAMSGNMVFFPGATGMTVGDSPTLEPGVGTWSIEVDYYGQTTSNAPVWQKQHAAAMKYQIYSPVSDNISFLDATAPGMGILISSAITNGWHKVRLTDTGAALLLYIDDVLKATTVHLAFTDYDDVWVFGSVATPYITSANITIDGTEQGHWHYTYDSTAPYVFPDLSGQGHDATPTFSLTTSSDPDVSASLSTYAPINPAALSSYSVTTTGSLLSGNVTTPAKMFTSGNHTYIIGGEAIDAILTESNIPKVLWWYPFIFYLIALVGLLMYEVTSGNNQTVMMQWIICEVLLVLFGTMNPIPLAAAFLFPVAAFAIQTSQKHQSLG